jgi:hypothetical protein
MKPIVFIHGYSAESDGSGAQDINGIYGDLPQRLRDTYGAGATVSIDVSRYISLEDGVTVDDISRALDQALRFDHPDLLQTGFNAIVHSTGALVIRNWVRRFSPKPSPVERIIYLAGASFGSGWAHIGKGQLAKWARLVFQAGAERGVQVLDALELGSSWTLDLNLHFLRDKQQMRADYGVFEFVVCGTQADAAWFEAPIRYSREDGSDGVVRVSASNVNTQYLRFAPTQAALALPWQKAAAQEDQHMSGTGKSGAHWYEPVELIRPEQPGTPAAPGVVERRRIPFAIPYQCAHTGSNMGIVVGQAPRQQVLSLIRSALAVTSDAEWQQRVIDFAQVTDQTYAAAQALQGHGLHLTDPRAQYDGHSQVIFRIRDQDGRPVPHFDVFFDSEHTPQPSLVPIRDLFEDRHVNDLTPNTIAFYLRTKAFDSQVGGWTPRLPDVRGVYLEICRCVTS